MVAQPCLPSSNITGPQESWRRRIRGATRGWCPATTKISCKDFGLTWNAALEAGVTGKLKNEQILVSVSDTGIASAASGGTGSLSVLYN